MFSYICMSAHCGDVCFLPTLC